MDKLSSATSREVIDKLSNHFSRYGIPELFITDGGPQFGSLEFKEFARAWEFENHLTTPYHSQSNGKAESAVKEAKRLLKKAASANRNPKLILLEHRNTATGVIELSPAQRMFNRRMQTQVPTTIQLLQPTLFDDESLKSRLQERQEKYQSQYDKHSKKMITLKPGDTVWVEPLVSGKSVWEKAKVVDTYGRNSFIIKIDGRRYHRSRVHLRKATGDLDKADCNMYMNERIPFSQEEAGEATFEEKDRGSTMPVQVLQKP